VNVLLALVTPLLGFWNRGRQIAPIDNGITEIGQALAEPRNAKGRRAHIDATTAGTKVQWNADDMDGTHCGRTLFVSRRFEFV
jgi:hypothetical protein